MIDILLEHQYSIAQLHDFLSEVFGCSVDRVKILGIDEFNSLTEELDYSALDCICVLSLVRGDCSQLLQLYRYKTSDLNAIQRVVDIAFRRNMHCYTPSDAPNGWIYVGDDDTPKHARQIECDEDYCFLFQLTKQ